MGIEEVKRITITCDDKGCPRNITSTTYTRKQLIDRARNRDWYISIKHGIVRCPTHRDNIMRKTGKKPIPEF